ncbi:hypothetical protein PHLCEN_2v8532 [Hermanssonia centrifuga]|uniref:Uncharacterized protein n=1 Tax=Hermanssonia centrifuga TaxID=98765 RepID=A0A2R6NTC2_9APHY|nr:hypothetical protein PHLCEN_2v8532 [Hermanssonia centrifuga]
MHFTAVLSFAILLAGAFAAPLSTRQETVSNVTCTDPKTTLDSHTSNVALLQICGGIAGTIEKCQGAPKSTTGQSGDVLFTIKPVDSGATINISKGRWEQVSYA